MKTVFSFVLMFSLLLSPMAMSQANEDRPLEPYKKEVIDYENLQELKTGSSLFSATQTIIEQKIALLLQIIKLLRLQLAIKLGQTVTEEEVAEATTSTSSGGGSSSGGGGSSSSGSTNTTTNTTSTGSTNTTTNTTQSTSNQTTTTNTTSTGSTNTTNTTPTNTTQTTTTTNTSPTNTTTNTTQSTSNQTTTTNTTNTSSSVSPLVMEPGVDYPILNSNSQNWIFCSELYFGGCSFEGLREIRYGNENRWVVREYFDGFPGWFCHPDRFGTTAQPGDRCEVASGSKTGTLKPPAHTMSDTYPSVNLSKIPMGSLGKSTLEIISTNDYGRDNKIEGVGAFRVPCKYSHMAFNDPIVYPGQPGRSHLHTFFGNTGVNAYSTAATIAGSGNSTCPGGIANRSSYWIPTLIDTTDGTPMIPTDSIWYYKTGYRGVSSEDIEIIPNGLKMIAGDPNDINQGNFYWNCTNDAYYYDRSKTIPTTCKAGENLTLTIFFPQCWDGVNLDSWNHRSHMAFSEPNGCPASHPVALPEISLNVSYAVPVTGATRNWRLSSDKAGQPAGNSLHADFFEGWDVQVKRDFIQNCVARSVDCHAYLLGNGTMLSTEQ